MTAPWREGLKAARGADGRLRLIHGPIDVILWAEGPAPAVAAAETRATRAMEGLLARLAAELPRLRAPAGPLPEGPVARAMVAAVAPWTPVFVTPMAAVAGAVADHLLAAMLAGAHGLLRAAVNNGGDIALWPGEGDRPGAAPIRIAVCADPLRGRPGVRLCLAPGQGIGGVATSGWRGRSLSLGIADAVTVLARDGARADVAATLIANAVDLPGHPAIARRPACDLAPDSDLGARLVTVDVGGLGPGDVARALDAGARVAHRALGQGLIAGAALTLGGGTRLIGAPLLEKEP